MASRRQEAWLTATKEEKRPVRRPPGALLFECDIREAMGLF